MENNNVTPWSLPHPHATHILYRDGVYRYAHFDGFMYCSVNNIFNERGLYFVIGGHGWSVFMAL